MVALLVVFFCLPIALSVNNIAIGPLGGWTWLVDACGVFVVLHGPVCLGGCDTLRQVCLEQGLDDTGPVWSLRQRLADHIRRGPMDSPAKPEVTQASVSTDLKNNTGITTSPVVPSGSHGCGGDGPIPVLVDCYVRSPPVLGRARSHYAAVC